MYIIYFHTLSLTLFFLISTMHCMDIKLVITNMAHGGLINFGLHRRMYIFTKSPTTSFPNMESDPYLVCTYNVYLKKLISVKFG